MKHYTFVKCNGPVEGKEGDRINILLNDRADNIIYYAGEWCWEDDYLGHQPVTDWAGISVLREVEGVVMSRKQCEKLWDAGEEYGVDMASVDFVSTYVKAKDKETTINSLFK